MIDLILSGRKGLVSAASSETRELATLPALSLTDLSGRSVAAEDLAGRVVLVEFWATWCPPCRSTLEWLGTLKAQYGDKLAILALAVESPEAGVRATASALNPDVRWAITDSKTAQSFGDITAVPTMFLFDRSGKTARVLYGAPPGLHEQVGALLDSLLR